MTAITILKDEEQ